MSYTPAPATKPKTKTKKSTIDMNLLTLMQGKLYTYLTPHGEVWTSLPCGGGKTNVPESRLHVRLSSERVVTWVQAHYNMEYGGTIARKDIEPTIGTITGIVQEHDNIRDVYNRLAPGKPWPKGSSKTPTLYLDLGIGQRTVKITAEGWEPVDQEFDAFFQRAQGFLPLPEPARGGSLAELRQFVNCPTGLPDPQAQAKSDANWHKLLAWLLGTLMPRTGAYAHLLLVSEKGSGKSTVARFLRSLVDPNSAALHSDPANGVDILRKASKSHVIGFDNISHLTPGIADALCRLSTGLDDSQRKLYTNDGEILYSVQGPAILTGINDLARSYDDLAQRIIRVELPHISAAQRKAQARLEADFNAARPRILGALLDAAVAGMRYSEAAEVELEEKPRLADLCIWLHACEHALLDDPAFRAQQGGQNGWEKGTFAKTLEASRVEMRDLALEANAVTYVLMQLLDEQVDRAWTGPMDDLLGKLGAWAVEHGLNIRNPLLGWPANPQRLSEILRRSESDLAERGLVWREAGRGHGGVRRKTFVYNPPDAADTADTPAYHGPRRLRVVGGSDWDDNDDEMPV